MITRRGLLKTLAAVYCLPLLPKAEAKSNIVVERNCTFKNANGYAEHVLHPDGSNTITWSAVIPWNRLDDLVKSGQYPPPIYPGFRREVMLIHDYAEEEIRSLWAFDVEVTT